MPIDYGITGKKALVCAASEGLGRASALALAEAGVELLLCARTLSRLQQLCDEIQSQYPVSVGLHACDLTDAASRTELLAVLSAQWPQGADIVVHNGGGPAPSTVMTTPTSAWQAGFDQLFMPSVHLNETLVPAMQAKGWGRVIHITSGSVAEPTPMLPVSNALRAAVTAYNKTLAREVAATGVTVNCVAPGYVETARMGQMFEYLGRRDGIGAEQARQRLEDWLPARRLGRPEEFGPVVAFLASQQASYLTGETLLIDGGKHQGLL